MNKRNIKVLAAALYTVCIISFIGVLGCMFALIDFSHIWNVSAAFVAGLSGYLGSFFLCSVTDKQYKQKMIMKNTVSAIFALYIVVLADFTLIDGGFGRNIFNFLKWNSRSFSDYLDSNVNLIPFATVRLYIRGYMKGYVNLPTMVENIFGNFFAFMPFAFFVPLIFKGANRWYKLFLTVVIAVLCIEFLQFVFLTGSVDLDDVILNVSGAMFCYGILTLKPVSRRVSKLFFGLGSDCRTGK